MPDRFTWAEGCVAAVSLSYDDALNVHHRDVAPLLEAHGLRGTFYTPINDRLMDNVSAWRRVADADHELGNHSVFHPCRKAAGAGWPDDAFDLRRYCLHRLERELDVANRVLRLIDGQSERSYGATCGHTTVGPDGEETSIVPVLREMFVAARTTGRAGPIDPIGDDLADLGLVSGDGKTADELRERIEEAAREGGWLILMIHGVGGEHRLFIDADEHRRLVAWLGSQTGRLWTAPVRKVARHVVRQRGGS